MTASRIHLLIAALMGAAGVALWAMAAHRPNGAPLVTAAQFLLFHSPAIIAITACRKLGLLANRIVSLAVAALVLGILLFCGDIVMRSFAGSPLFTMAAPAGGSLTILGWLGVAVAAFSPAEKTA
jgi:uncharacterized membrane protein YgdD (TMEM256/DUF423 family)